MRLPPLEGFWRKDGIDGVDYSDQSVFNRISVTRLPELVTEEDFSWTVETAEKKKKLDCSFEEFLTVTEGLCVQIMHTGPFDNKPNSVVLMYAILTENGLENDMDENHLHHEIYMSDARKVASEK